MTTQCKIIRLSDYRRPPQPANPWAEAIAWWLTWAANITQAAADSQYAMAKALSGERR